MRRVAGIAVLLVLASCPPPPQLEGKLCDERGECPNGLVCFNGKCRAERCDPDQLGQPCVSGVGACARSGTWSCLQAEQTCSGGQGDPLPEVCNGIDDDCDGNVDDSVLDAGEACIGGFGVCRGEGTRVCADGGPVCQPSNPVDAGAEICGNGIDEDCDGLADDGCLSTIAGSGPPGDRDGHLEDAMFYRPEFMAAGRNGDVFLADSSNNKVKVIRPDGGVWTVAGNGACALVDGPALAASFCQPRGVAVAQNGDVWVSDSRNQRIRVVRDPLTPMATVETRFADAGPSPPLATPRGLSFLSDGGLVVADPTQHRIYLFTTRGFTIGSGRGFGDGDHMAVQFQSPVDVVQIGDGELAVSESHRIRRVVLGQGSMSSTIAGSTDGDSGYLDRAGVAARFNGPQQLLFEPDAGRLLVPELGSSSGVRAVPLDNTVSTSTVYRPLVNPIGIAPLSPNNFAVSELTAHWVRRVVSPGDGGPGQLQRFVSNSAYVPSFDGDASFARLSQPDRLVFVPPHTLVWTDATSVRMMVLDAGYVVTAVSRTSGDGGPDGPLFQGGWIGTPVDAKLGPGGAVYVTDSTNRTVRKLDFDAGRIETVTSPFTGSISVLAFSKSPVDGEDLLFVVEGAVLWRIGMQSNTRQHLSGLDSGVTIAGVTGLVGGENGDVILVDTNDTFRRFTFDGGVQPFYRYIANSNVRTFAFDAQGRILFGRGPRVHRADPRDGGIETVFDSAQYPAFGNLVPVSTISGFADGPHRVGIIGSATSVALDGDRLFVSDEPNNRVRLLLLPR